MRKPVFQVCDLVRLKPDFWVCEQQRTDQPVHPRNLISVYVFRLLESSISKLATSKISMFWQVFVIEQAGLGITLLGTVKTARFSRDKAHIVSHYPNGSVSGFLCSTDFPCFV